MEIEKAIKILKGRKEFVADINIDTKIAYKMAIESLEKGIPKKVTHEGFCPICKTQFPMYPPTLNKYCSNCGQKLDWD